MRVGKGGAAAASSSAASSSSVWWESTVPLLFPQPQFKPSPNRLLFQRIYQFVLHGIAWRPNEEENFPEPQRCHMTLRLSVEHRGSPYYAVSLLATVPTLTSAQRNISLELLRHAFEGPVAHRVEDERCTLSLKKDVTHWIGDAEAAEKLARCMAYVRVLWLAGPFFAEIRATSYGFNDRAAVVVVPHTRDMKMLWLSAEKTKATVVVADPTSAMPHDIRILVTDIFARLKTTLQKRRRDKPISVALTSTAPNLFKLWAQAERFPQTGSFITISFVKDNALQDTQFLLMAKFALGVSTFIATTSLRNRLRLRWQSLDMVCGLQRLACVQTPVVVN